MIIPDSKKIQTIMMSKRDAKGKKTMETSGMQPEAASNDPVHSAAESLIGAMHEKSPGKVVDAMKSFMHHHKVTEE